LQQLLQPKLEEEETVTEIRDVYSRITGRLSPTWNRATDRPRKEAVAGGRRVAHDAASAY
jgi:hypothetical protein